MFKRLFYQIFGDSYVRCARTARIDSASNREYYDKKIIKKISRVAINPAVHRGESECLYDHGSIIPNFIIESLEQLGYHVYAARGQWTRKHVTAITISWNENE